MAYRSEDRMPELPRLPLSRAGATGIGRHAMIGFANVRLARTSLPVANLNRVIVKRARITFLASEADTIPGQASAAV